jgi:hypothetical protein
MGGICPECASALLPPAAKAPGILRPALAGIGFICVTGAVLYVGLSNFHTAHAYSVSGGAGFHEAAYPHLVGFTSAKVAGPIVPAALTPAGGAGLARAASISR